MWDNPNIFYPQCTALAVPTSLHCKTTVRCICVCVSGMLSAASKERLYESNLINIYIWISSWSSYMNFLLCWFWCLLWTTAVWQPPAVTLFVHGSEWEKFCRSLLNTHLGSIIKVQSGSVGWRIHVEPKSRRKQYELTLALGQFLANITTWWYRCLMLIF